MKEGNEEEEEREEGEGRRSDSRGGSKGSKSWK